MLVYYAIANAAAATLRGRLVPALGLAGCVVLAACLPIGAVLAGSGVLILGALVYGAGRLR